MESSSTHDPVPAEGKRGEIWVQRAITLWVVLAVAVSVKTIVQRDHHTVYPIFAAASQHWWADVPLYADYEGMDIYRYSPTFAIALTPFAVLPNWLGGIVWNLVSIAVLVWSLRVLVHEVLPGPWPPRREGLFLGLALVGSVRGIWSAQSNALLFALVAFATAAIAKRRWSAAAILLALPVFIKLWPLAIALLLMACWPKQLIWRFSVAGAVLAGVPFLTRPLTVVAGQYSGWYLSLTGRHQDRWPGFRDARTIWENIHPPVNQHAYLVLQLATAAAVLGWCLWQKWRTDSSGRLLTSILSIWVGWQLLFGPGTERLTYGIIAPMATWALLVSFAEKKGRLLSTAAWLMTGILGSGGVERALTPQLPAAPIILPLGVVVFIVWLVIHERGPAVSLQEAAPVADTSANTLTAYS